MGRYDVGFSISGMVDVFLAFADRRSLKNSMYSVPHHQYEAVLCSQLRYVRFRNLLSAIAKKKMSDMSEEITSVTEEHVAETTVGEKRKRDATAVDEIEVDINAPEPPSKKAKRKAKKGKPIQANETIKSKTTTHREVDATDPVSSPSPSPSDFEDLSSHEAPKAPPKVVYGVWIGNLPFTCTSSSLRSYLIKTSPAINDANVARVHMPAPAPGPATRGAKPHNKGFAYVDFTSQEVQQAAIELSETQMGGRNLLIKSSKDFQGRPDKHANQTSNNSKTSALANDLATGNAGHPPSKRVFVGNLAYDMTRDDLQKNFEPCGEILDIHTANFEDTGRSKGYAWVTFAAIEAAEAAVRGWCKAKVDNDDALGDNDRNAESQKRKKKTQKWFVNRIHGRQLRCEFAEDSTVRYKRRFGKSAKDGSEQYDGSKLSGKDNGEMEDAMDAEPEFQSDTKYSEAATRSQKDRKKIDARTIPPGAALANANRGKMGLVEGQGTKITFD